LKLGVIVNFVQRQNDGFFDIPLPWRVSYTVSTETQCKNKQYKFLFHFK